MHFKSLHKSSNPHILIPNPTVISEHLINSSQNRNNHTLQKRTTISSFLSLFKLSSSTQQLFQIHAQILTSGLHNCTFLITELVRVAALSSHSKNLFYARSILNNLDHFSPFSWNVVIRGYATSDSPKEAILVFREMRGRGIRPNKLTYPFVVKACGVMMGVKEGRQVHSDVLKTGLNLDVYVNNNLINFYGSCKKIVYARKVFDEMLERTLVSWNTLIKVCVENFQFADGIKYFVKMRNSGFEPDETTMVILLSCCAELGNLSLGKWIHSQVIEKGLVLNFQLGTSLVDMYAKSGSLRFAKLVFDRIHEKNVWTWSAMILGLAQHGFANEALKVFSKMTNSSVLPNYVTFLGVLCACSHAGLVNDGYKYFHDMKHKHGIEPLMIHYGAMVDILCRARHLKAAYDFIMKMPVQPDPIIWRTLLSACGVHDVGDIDKVGNEVRKRLLELEPDRGGNLVMVANMYAKDGMWEKAENVRSRMKNRGMMKMAGESCIELSGSIYKFFSGFDSRDDFEVIYDVLDRLVLHMQMVNL